MTSKKNLTRIDSIKDFPGANIPEDVVEVKVIGDKTSSTINLTEPLDVSDATVTVQQSGTVQVSVDNRDYPEYSNVEHDLASGDLVVGPLSVKKTTAILLSVKSVDSSTWSVTARWKDNSGNEYMVESPSDISLVDSVDDWVRLIRKGPRVEFTITDTSGNSQNRINTFVDTHE